MSKVKNFINIFLLMCIIFGIILHIVPYFYNRSLWIDEAAIASSICTRNLITLAKSSLDAGQSAPIGYLYIVKILTIICGNSKTVLRLTSLISGIGCIGLIYLLLKDKVQKYYALFFTTTFSFLDQYIYYSNELKSYMFDNFCCLIVLYVYQKYKEEKLKIWQVIILYSIIIWCSFSAVFFVAASMIIISISLLIKFFKERKVKQIKNILLCGIVLVSFIFNYCFWLSKTQSNAGEKEYWNLFRFPLILTSMNDLKTIFALRKEFFAFYPRILKYVIVILFFVYCIIVIYKKEDKSKILISYILSILLSCMASYLGFFPFKDRLIQCLPIPLIIFSAFAISEIEMLILKTDKIKKFNKLIIGIYCTILIVCLVQVINEGYPNLSAKHVYTYRSNSEIGANIKFLKDNLKSEDMVYVYDRAILTYLYENDYQVNFNDISNHLPCIIDNTIYGKSLFLKNEKTAQCEIDVEAIKSASEIISNYDTVYLFTSHVEFGLKELIEELSKTGEVKIANESYNAKLYEYIKRNNN